MKAKISVRIDMLSLNFFETLFRSSPHPYLILKADDIYTIVDVNDYYLNATGIIRENVIGKPLFEIFPDNPKDETVSGVSDLHISLDSVVRYAQTDMMGVQKYDIPLRDGSGEFEVKYWSPINVPVFDADGKVEYIIHNVEDVTDFILLKQESGLESQHDNTKMMHLEAEVLKRANEVKEANRIIKARESELAVLNEKLKELDRLKTEFFSNISHEFRTPLTLMLAPIEELLNNRHTLPDERITSNLEIAHRNLLRLLKLVNTLLDFSRIEAGRVKASFEATDISALTADLASNFSSASELAQVQLIVDCPPLKEWIEVDHDMWEKIVLNLLSNAFKFTHEGSITVTTRIENNKAVLTVSDTGIGIPKEELPKLFERFYRVENAGGRTHEGTGIGLSLVQELVKLQGGTIEVESREGVGTRFSVFMPLGVKHETFPADPHKREVNPHALQAYTAEVMQWSTPKSQEAIVHHNISKGKILVVDDNPDMREFIKRLLVDAGYDVLLATDGEDAWQMCQNTLPDLILSDVMMPKMNGFELIKKLRSTDYTYALPIILISARAGEADKAEGLMSGADDYLSKPFHSGELIARVDGAVKLGQYRRRAHEELLKTTNQIAKIGGWSFDVETMRGEWTEELIRIHDLPPGELIDVQKGLDFYTPESRPIIEQAVQEAITEGKVYDLELEIISAKGVRKWVRTVGTPMIVEGKVIKVNGVMQDITKQKLDEIEQNRSNALLNAIINSTPDAIFIKDIEGKYLLFNHAASEMTGKSEKEALGNTDEALFTPEGASKLHEIDQNIINDGVVKSQEEFATTLTGEDKVFWATKGPIYTEEGSLLGLFGISRDITEHKRAEENIISYLKKLKKAMNGTLLAVSNMVEQRDPYTTGHEQRVGLIPSDIACEMGYSEDKCEELREIGLVHDIGKIAIPAEILSKPTKLSVLEYELIKSHSERGYEILKNIDFPFPVAEIVYQHHERMDGSGYPRGLKGDEILMEARILTIADVIEAMASHRPYRAGLGIDQALAEIERGKGTSYDAKVVDDTLRLFREKKYSIPI
jgi:PAS domain S-box-containing protein